MPRRYLHKGAAMLRLIRFIQRYQAEHLVAPASYSAMAVAVGTSPSQAKRLLAEAEAAGILRRSSESALRYDVILSPPHLPGIVRVPLVDCLWSQRIRWTDFSTRGVWLDRATYRIEGNGAGLWAVTFPERPKDGQARCLRLDENALALVRRCHPAQIKESYWYLIESGSCVIVASCVKRVARALLFRAGIGHTTPDRLALADVHAAAEVMMVTTRPPIRAPLPQLK